MMSNTYAIRAGAQQFASVAEGMRHKASSIEQNATALLEKWRGKAADSYQSVSELLGNDIQTASQAFEQAANALYVLAGQLDQVNSLRQQAEQLSSQIQSLEWSLSGADDHNRASISSEISQLSYRRSNLLNEADSLEYQANAAASAAFDDIAGMVNRLHFSHGTQAAASSDSSVLDKVGHFFSGLWHKTEDAVEDAYQAVNNEFKKVGDEIEQALDDFQGKVEQGGWLGGTVGFVEGLASSVIDTLEFAAKVNPMNMIQNAILHPEATYEKAKAIFKDLEHPVQTAEHLWDGAKVLWSTAKQSFDQDIIHGNAYTRSKWAGYAVGVIAQTLATDGAAAAAKGTATVTKGAIAATKGVAVAGEGVEMATEGIDQVAIGIRVVTTQYSSKNLHGLQSFQSQINDVLDIHGISLDQFNELRVRPVDQLSVDEIDNLKKIRDSVEPITNNSILQKSITKKDIVKYLNGSYTEIGGYFAKTEDVLSVRTYDELVESLRLDYLDRNGNRPFPDGDDTFGVIRFKTENEHDIQIPYGEKFGGTNTDGYPCTLNGFTGARNGKIIPEWKFDDYFEPQDGAELYIITNGKEELVGVYDSSISRFIAAKEK